MTTDSANEAYCAASDASAAYCDAIDAARSARSDAFRADAELAAVVAESARIARAVAFSYATDVARAAYIRAVDAARAAYDAANV